MDVYTPSDSGDGLRFLFEASPCLPTLSDIVRFSARNGHGVYLSAWRRQGDDGAIAVILFRDIADRRAWCAANPGAFWCGGFETNRAA